MVAADLRVAVVEKELTREELKVVVEAISDRGAPNLALLTSGVALWKLVGCTRSDLETVRRLRLTPDIISRSWVPRLSI